MPKDRQTNDPQAPLPCPALLCPHDNEAIDCPIDSHELTPGLRPTLALFRVTGAFRIKLNFFTSPDDLIQQATARRTRCYEDAGLQEGNPPNPMDLAHAALHMATPCAWYQLIQSPEELDRFADYVDEFESRIFDALSEMFAELDPVGRLAIRPPFANQHEDDTDAA